MTISSAKRLCPITRLLLVPALVLGLFGGVTTAGAAPAQAVVSAGVTLATTNRVLSYTATRKGAPYQLGAVGPSRFDCSGLTKWAYARVGKKLPRTAAQQYAATIRVSRAKARRGDLVFFMSGRTVYHTGIYAGAGKVWHAPKPGSRVKVVAIWTSAVTYGRVR